MPGWCCWKTIKYFTYKPSLKKFFIFRFAIHGVFLWITFRKRRKRPCSVLRGVQKGRPYFFPESWPPPRANVPQCPYSIPKIHTFEKCLFSTYFLLKTEVPFFRRTICPRRHLQVALLYFWIWQRKLMSNICPYGFHSRSFLNETVQVNSTKNSKEMFLL